MENMNSWDVVLFVVAGYLATMALVRLMIRRREQLLGEFRRNMKRAKKQNKEKQAKQERLGNKRKAA